MILLRHHFFFFSWNDPWINLNITKKTLNNLYSCLASRRTHYHGQNGEKKDKLWVASTGKKGRHCSLSSPPNQPAGLPCTPPDIQLRNHFWHFKPAWHPTKGIPTASISLHLHHPAHCHLWPIHLVPPSTSSLSAALYTIISGCCYSPLRPTRSIHSTVTGDLPFTAALPPTIFTTGKSVVCISWQWYTYSLYNIPMISITKIFQWWNNWNTYYFSCVFGSLSCWKTQLHPNPIFSLMILAFPEKCGKNSPFIFFSIILPPPCLTAALWVTLPSL